MTDKASEHRLCYSGHCNGQPQPTRLTETLNSIPMQPGKAVRCCASCGYIIAVEDAPADWARA